MERFQGKEAMARARQADANHHIACASQLFLDEHESTEAALSRSQAR